MTNQWFFHWTIMSADFFQWVQWQQHKPTSFNLYNFVEKHVIWVFGHTVQHYWHLLSKKEGKIQKSSASCWAWKPPLHRMVKCGGSAQSQFAFSGSDLSLFLCPHANTLQYLVFVQRLHDHGRMLEFRKEYHHYGKKRRGKKGCVKQNWQVARMHERKICYISTFMQCIWTEPAPEINASDKSRL